MTSKTLRALLSLSAIPLLASCFAITDLDRFRPSPDVVIAFDSFAAAAGNRVEFRLVTNEATPRYLARGVIDNYDNSAPFTMTFNNILPEGTLPTLEMFVDTDGNTVAAEDEPFFQVLSQSARVVVADPEPRGGGSYTDTPLQGPSNSVSIVLRGYEGIHPGQLFELKVVQTETGAVAGHYRIMGVGADQLVLLPRTFEDAAQFHLEFYADANDSGDYNDPVEDHTWRQDDVTITEFMHDSDWVPLSSFQGEAN